MSLYAATTEGAEALGDAAAETLIQLIGATTTKAKIAAWGISFDGTVATNTPVRVRLLRQSTAASGTGATEVKFDPDAPNAGCAATHSIASNPTAGDVIEDVYVHPQGGIYIKEYIPGREPVLDNLTTSRIGIEANAPQAVNCVAWIHWEE